MFLSLGEVFIDALIKGLILQIQLTCLLLQQESRYEVINSFAFKLLDNFCLHRTHHLLICLGNNLFNSVWLIDDETFDVLHLLHVLHELSKFLSCINQLSYLTLRSRVCSQIRVSLAEA